MLKHAGVKTIFGFNSNGVVSYRKNQTFVIAELIDEKILDLWDSKKGNTLASGIKNRDVFVGVSVAKILNKDMVQSMNKDPWIFAMTNPEPEIRPELAFEAGTKIVGTGRSDYPNQVNNLLVFPGIFRGAINANATKITRGMMLVVAKAISEYILDNDLDCGNILPSNLDKNMATSVAKYVEQQTIKEGVVTKI